MWEKPWNYLEGFALGAGLLVVGEVLQLTVGPVDCDAFAFPANVIVLAFFAILLVGIYATRSKVYAFRWLATVECAAPCLCYAALLTVVMGLVRQMPSTSKPADMIGITKMLSFWPFVLTYLWMAVVVSQVALRQLMHFSWRVMPSLLSHLGLLIVLFCATLGNADMKRLKMIAEVGQPEWRAIDEQQRVVEMSLAIELKQFILEEYPAEKVDSKDSTMVGMQREPKRFASEVNIFTKDGNNIHGTIDVNRPLKVNGWKIYQYGYDQSMGAMSNISIFELVSDPWQPFVYVGIYMMLAGDLLVFIVSNKKRKEPES